MRKLVKEKIIKIWDTLDENEHRRTIGLIQYGEQQLAHLEHFREDLPDEYKQVHHYVSRLTQNLEHLQTATETHSIEYDIDADALEDFINQAQQYMRSENFRIGSMTN